MSSAKEVDPEKVEAKDTKEKIEPKRDHKPPTFSSEAIRSDISSNLSLEDKLRALKSSAVSALRYEGHAKI